jgi:hypothetical protein
MLQVEVTPEVDGEGFTVGHCWLQCDVPTIDSWKGDSADSGCVRLNMWRQNMKGPDVQCIPEAVEEADSH